MTEEVRKLLLEENKKLIEEDNKNDEIIYEQALVGSKKASLMVWKSLLSQWKEAGLGEELKEVIKVLPPERISSKDITYRTRDKASELKQQIKMAKKFNSRNNDFISFAFLPKCTMVPIVPILIEYTVDGMQRDGLDVALICDGILYSSTVESFEEIIKNVNKKSSSQTKK